MCQPTSSVSLFTHHPAISSSASLHAQFDSLVGIRLLDRTLVVDLPNDLTGPRETLGLRTHSNNRNECAVSSSSPPFGWTIILLPSSLHFFSFSAAGGHNVLSIELFIIQQTVLLSLYGNEGKEGEMRDNKPKKKGEKDIHHTRK